MTTPELPIPEGCYLVTGGAGFVGSHIVERLVEAGRAVRVVDDFSTGRRENLEPLLDRGAELLEGSITNRGLCDEACRDVDFVLHQAALPSVQRSLADPVATHEANATGTLHLLEAAHDAGVRRLVYAGSSSVYGNTPELPKREQMTPRPRSPYAVAKLTGEYYCRVFAAVHGLETVSLRYFNVFGSRQDPTSRYAAVVPIFIRRALEGRPPTIDGDGEQTRDFTHVSNVVRANLLACVAPAGKASGRVFNVGCGERTTVNELWETIRDIASVELEAVHGPPRPGDVRDSLAAVEEAREGLEYEVAVSLEEGLRRTVAWYRQRSSTL